MDTTTHHPTAAPPRCRPPHLRTAHDAYCARVQARRTFQRYMLVLAFVTAVVITLGLIVGLAEPDGTPTGRGASAAPEARDWGLVSGVVGPEPSVRGAGE